ncbi:MAG: MBL fold metallo-hydrolase [Daejeonella sp.]|uniref:MBL fold metallo-hydrolase n=1 Tax=Daejeonella sp. TaxID=2805397 RepID=UPI003C76EC3B
MKVTFLGTGTSQGVPVIACDCEVCMSKDSHDKRLRVSVLIEIEGKSLVIDAGPDFRYQMLRAGVKHLDAILFTHEHKDHVAGLDDVRAFNHKQQTEIDVYADARVLAALRQEFHYIFSGANYPGIPRLELHKISADQNFTVAGIEVIPVTVMHYKLPVFGYRIGDFTYITDAKTIDAENIDRMRGSKVVVINALQKENHISHLTLEEAVSLAEEIGAEQTYFTHISHRLGTHKKISSELPPGVYLAYDGLQLHM